MFFAENSRYEKNDETASKWPEVHHMYEGKRLDWLDRKSLSEDEALRVISNLQGEFHLMASQLYSGGLRLTECLNLRVKDIDFCLNGIVAS